jgi:hypothetical protein
MVQEHNDYKIYEFYAFVILWVEMRQQMKENMNKLTKYAQFLMYLYSSL